MLLLGLYYLYFVVVFSAGYLTKFYASKTLKIAAIQSLLIIFVANMEH